MSVAAITFQDDGTLSNAATDARIQALARRLSHANHTIEKLEDQLVATRVELKHTQRARADAEKNLNRARDRAVAARATAKADTPTAVINGSLRLACNKTEAAEMLGVSVDFFDDHIAHEVRCVRRGRRRLYAVAELERWLDRASESVGAGGYSP